MKPILSYKVFKRTIPRLFLIGFLFICITPLQAQITLSGMITDKSTGEALPFANISIKNSFVHTISSIEGRYTLQMRKKGTFTISVSYVGFQPFEQLVELNRDQILDVELSPGILVTDETVIVGNRADEKTPMTFKNLGKADIDPVNLGQDMPFMLQLTPSLVVTSDAGNGIGYTSMRIRGTDISRINVTLNGIPLNDPESQNVFWVDIPDLSSSVESIQVQRGVGTSTNGAGAFGASVNISTQNVEYEPYAEISSAAGSFNTLKNSIKFGTGLIDGRWTIDGRLSKTSSDGYIDRSWSDLSSFFTSASMVDDKNLLKINVFSGTEETYQAWNGLPGQLLDQNRTFNPSGLYFGQDGDTTFYDNEIDHYRQDHFQVIYARSWSRRSNFNLALHYTHGNGFYENYRMDQKFRKYGIPDAIIGGDTIMMTDLIRQKWLDNHFYGITFSFTSKLNDRMELKVGGAINRYDGDHYGTIKWAEYYATIPLGFRWYENDGHKSDFNLFGKLNLNVTQSITSYFDFQYRYINYQMNGIHDDLRDISQKHKFHFFNPKTGVLIKLNDHLQSYLSFGMANREPSRNDFRDADTVRQPLPERLFNTEWGSTYKSGNFIVNANVFWMDYKNQLIQTGMINNVGDQIMINVAKSFRTGLELSGSYIPYNWLKFEMSTTISRNKIVDFIEYVDNWSPPYGQIENSLGKTDLAFSPDLTGYATIETQMIKNMSMRWVSRYVGKQFIDNTSNDMRVLEPYFVNDLSFVYKVKTKFIPEIAISLLVNNIFSEKYETNAWIYRYYEDGTENNINGYFPQAPIHFMAGLKFKF